MLFARCFLVAEAVFWFRRNEFRFYISAQSYADKLHGLCRLPSGVKTIPLVFCSQMFHINIKFVYSNKMDWKCFSSQSEGSIFANSTNCYTFSPSCSASNVKNGLKVKQCAKQSPTLKMLLQKISVELRVIFFFFFSILGSLKLNFSTTVFGLT